MGRRAFVRAAAVCAILAVAGTSAAVSKPWQSDVPKGCTVVHGSFSRIDARLTCGRAGDAPGS